MRQNSSLRPKIIWVLVLFISFFGSISIIRYVNRPPKYVPKYRTVAHRFMDLESKYVTVPDESYKLLDDIITEAKAQTHYDPTITDPAKREENLLTVFDTIDSILIEKNFIFPSGEITSTLGQALEDRQLSSKELAAALAEPHNTRRAPHMRQHADENFHLMACEPAAFLYMGVAEAIGFDLKPVVVPEHIFVRAQLDKDHWMNWDGNRGRSIPDEEYIRDWGVADWQVQQNIYMHSLSADETLGEMYTSVGVRMADEAIFGRYGPSIECYRRALQLNPNDIYANYDLPNCLLFQPDPDAATRSEALACAQHATAMQPYDESFHETLSFALAANDQTDLAVGEMKKAIQLAPQNTEMARMLPLIQAGYSMYGAEKAQRPISTWLRYENGWLYISIFVVGLALTGVVFFFLWRVQVQAQKAASTPAPIPT